MQRPIKEARSETGTIPRTSGLLEASSGHFGLGWILAAAHRSPRGFGHRLDLPGQRRWALPWPPVLRSQCLWVGALADASSTGSRCHGQRKPPVLVPRFAVRLMTYWRRERSRWRPADRRRRTALRFLDARRRAPRWMSHFDLLPPYAVFTATVSPSSCRCGSHPTVYNPSRDLRRPTRTSMGVGAHRSVPRSPWRRTAGDSRLRDPDAFAILPKPDRRFKE